MKVVSWNIENAMRCIGELPHIAQQLGSPDVLCLQELRIRAHDADAVRRGTLAIVNVYAVNGIARPYYDATGRVCGDRHAFKRRFQAHVMDLGGSLRRECAVVMAGDWNVSRTAEDTHPRLRKEAPHARARAELNDRLAANGFVDIWRERHPAQRAYTWFNRRSRSLDAARVDYTLVSEDLAHRVRAAKILDRLPWSDHAPVMVEL